MDASNLIEQAHEEDDIRVEDIRVEEHEVIIIY